jgi:DNA-binding transcriptional LysR family regulator
MPPGSRRYKELTLQQLRSLCETARRGSFVAAAAALDVSQPTVWKQVHALEREFGVKLVEAHGRGCAMTAAGQSLVELVGPAVEAITSARERFRALLANEGDELSVALPPRTLLEEVGSCLGRFHARSPKTRFTFRELDDELVADAVLERRADFGLTPVPLAEEQRKTLVAEPLYALEVRLITPRDHPLARRRTVRLPDLRPYPFVHGPAVCSIESTRAVLERSGADQGAKYLVHTGFASSIRRFVRMGFGIGLVPAIPSAPHDPDLHERSMSGYIGEIGVHLVRRRGAYVPPAGEDFIQFLRQELGTQASQEMGRNSRRRGPSAP